MGNISGDHIPKINSQVTSRLVGVKESIEQEAVLVLAENGQVKVLNAVGAYIWLLIDGKRKIGELVDLLHREYEVDWTVAYRDSINFLDELEKKGFIDIVNE
jgi:hypothetical protein